MKPDVRKPIQQQIHDLASQKGLSLADIRKRHPEQAVLDFHKELYNLSGLYGVEAQAQAFGLPQPLVSSRCTIRQ